MKLIPRNILKDRVTQSGEKPMPVDNTDESLLCGSMEYNDNERRLQMFS